jgi:Ca2+-binding RTX toxin-like protein
MKLRRTPHDGRRAGPYGRPHAPRHSLPLVFTAAALAGAAATAPAAQAAATCKLESGVLEVRMIDPGFARFAVVGGAIVVLVDGNQSTCAGGPPTTKNTDAVLVVDDSDDVSTPTPHDGFSGVLISDPQSFAPGINVEPTGTSEIEFLLDMREGLDQLVVSAPSVAANLVIGSDGANWNGDDDRDLSTMGYDIVRLYGGAGDDRMSVGGGAGTGAPLTQVILGEMRGGAGDDTLRGSDGPTLETIYGEEGDDVVAGGEGPDVLLGGPGDDTFTGGGGVDRSTTSDRPCR